jgi:single-stranded-DNA-specific exonuclease
LALWGGGCYNHSVETETLMARAWKPNTHRWQIAPAVPDAADLARQLRTTPLVATILHHRGATDVEAGSRFLKPSLSHLHDPSELPGCERAAHRIAQAVANDEKIVIYGDYDVDGMTAVAILHRCLTMVGATPEFYVPHRLEEGYGVNDEAIDAILADGTQLIVTVDCGITAEQQLARAREAGVDVIVTDHHRPSETLPGAVAIVHPDLPGESYPNPGLCGAGVALKLAWQVAREITGAQRVDDRLREFLLDATCLAALGTIADIVPLRGENRALAVFGLRGLPQTHHPGLMALLESTNLIGETLDAFHVGFRLAPRLNACGRMGHARLAVELLTSAPAEKAGEIARYLAQQNTERQKTEREIAAEAIEMVLADGDLDQRRVIVLASEDWHGGVIGIVASRLVDRFHRPAVLIAINGDGTGQGSGRSVPGFHMHRALTACGEHLISYGGHEMAGGVRIDSAKIDEFAAAMEEFGRSSMAAESLEPTLQIDAEATLDDLRYRTVHHLAGLSPFGQGNPPPVIVLRGMKLLGQPKRMGKTGKTLGMVLGDENGRIRAVGFGMGDLAEELIGVRTVDVAAEPTLNHFRGNTSVELKLRDVKW